MHINFECYKHAIDCYFENEHKMGPSPNQYKRIEDFMNKAAIAVDAFGLTTLEKYDVLAVVAAGVTSVVCNKYRKNRMIRSATNKGISERVINCAVQIIFGK